MILGAGFKRGRSVGRFMIGVGTGCFLGRPRRRGSFLLVSSVVIVVAAVSELVVNDFS